ncbi:MAG: site-specific DNA-methyltransferase [Ignavibacteriae bacterium]|nr:site-specific DNA-methyltransferase [Ignavibacteriota bacterium]
MSEKKEMKIAEVKGRPMLHWIGKQPLETVKSFPAQLVETFNTDTIPKVPTFENLKNDWTNLLLHGDNREVMSTLLVNGFQNKVDFVYIDPPFNTGLDYVRKVKLRGTNKKLEGDEMSFDEQIMYENAFLESNFLQFMKDVLLLLSNLLNKDTGLIAVRIDYNYSHYIKVILDEVFSKDNFINEIIIGRSRETAGSHSKLEVTTESIYLYSKSNDYKLNQIFAKRPISEIAWTGFTMGGDRNPPERSFFNKIFLPLPGQHFTLKQEKCDKLIKEHFLRLKCKDCGCIYFYGDSEHNFNKQSKKKENRFKYYDISSSTEFKVVIELKECLNCGKDNFNVEYLGNDDVQVNNNWMDIPSYATTTGYPTENSEDLLNRIIRLCAKPDKVIMDCFNGSGTTAAVAQKLGMKWIACDINKSSIQTTSSRLQSIIRGQEKIIQKEKGKLKLEERKTFYTSFAHYKINDYDVQIQHNELKELVIEHLGIKRLRIDSFFDGTLGTELVKIIPFNHPLSLYDVQLVKNELGKRKDETRNIILVSLGMEVNVKTEIDSYNKLRPVNKIRTIELRTDKKYGSFFVHKPAQADISITKQKDKAKVIIKDFISPTILQRLNIDSKLFQAQIKDFRSQIDVVLIDTNYKGDVFNICISDVPEKKKDFIIGEYEFELNDRNSKIAVKIIDMLGEEVLKIF